MVGEGPAAGRVRLESSLSHHPGPPKRTTQTAAQMDVIDGDPIAILQVCPRRPARLEDALQTEAGQRPMQRRSRLAVEVSHHRRRYRGRSLPIAFDAFDAFDRPKALPPLFDEEGLLHPHLSVARMGVDREDLQRVPIEPHVGLSIGPSVGRFEADEPRGAAEGPVLAGRLRSEHAPFDASEAMAPQDGAGPTPGRGKPERLHPESAGDLSNPARIVSGLL